MTDWIKWDGGECPIRDDVTFSMRYHDGTEVENVTGAGRFWWGRDPEPVGYQIDAYKLFEAKPNEEKTAMTEKETNHLIAEAHDFGRRAATFVHEHGGSLGLEREAMLRALAEGWDAKAAQVDAMDTLLAIDGELL